LFIAIRLRPSPRSITVVDMASDSTSLTVIHEPAVLAVNNRPGLIVAAGPAASFAWDEFFSGHIRNKHTRAAYLHAVRRFLQWVEPHASTIERITPGMVGQYFDQHPNSIPTKKLHLAALRALFDNLVTRHIVLLNPAATVRGERYQAVEGKTPEISRDQARTLLASINISRPVGRRDKAIIATLIYTATRAGAVASLQLKDFTSDGTQYSLRFHEKGGKSRSIPVRHDLQGLLLAYLDGFAWNSQPSNAPLFRAIAGRTGELTERPLPALDVCRILKRRLKDAQLPANLSPHSFRVATLTDLLLQGVPLEDAQHLAGHADPRTTQLYDRRQRQVTRNTVERISI
jgi:site-specific recombinase XerD